MTISAHEVEDSKEASKTSTFEKFKENASSTDSESVPVLVISGSAGTGKSSLLAFSAKDSMSDSDLLVVSHFVGATAGSTSLYGLLSRCVFDFIFTRTTFLSNINDYIILTS